MARNEEVPQATKGDDSVRSPLRRGPRVRRLRDLPGYDVTTLVEKSGKSASHIYARLSLLQLIPEAAEAFTQERITASPRQPHRTSTARVTGRSV
jgi:hypothetical protein